MAFTRLSTGLSLLTGRCGETRGQTGKMSRDTLTGPRNHKLSRCSELLQNQISQCSSKLPI